MSITIYHKLGKIPHKRHTQFRKENGDLYAEELFGAEGFSGSSALLYHDFPPTRVKKVKRGASIRVEAAKKYELRHHHLLAKDVRLGGDPIEARTTLLFNNDVQIALARPTEKMNYFYRNGEHDEMLFIHEGTGYVQTQFGRLNFEPWDYIILPRGTTYQIVFDEGDARYLYVDSTGPIEYPKRYLSEFGQFLENSPFCERDFRLPEEPLYHESTEDSYDLHIKKQGYMHHYELQHHPFGVVGWDGYLYPYIFNIKDFEPITGRIHQPPPVHQTFAAHNYVVCSFVPRKFDYHPKSIPAPYNHSNVDSDEVLYYVHGEFMSRKGVDFASITHHPGGIPHGPHPGTVEKSIGAEDTEEYAVMIDTFKPLYLTQAALDLEDENYPYSWIEEDE